MRVTTTEANSKGLPESFENIRRIIIQHEDLELEVCVDGKNLVVRGIMDFGTEIAILPQAPNSVKVTKFIK